MKWRDCKLGDVLTLKRGHDLPEHTRQQGNVPVVSSSGITGFHNEAKAIAPGVVTGRYGTLGEVFYLEEDYWPLNTSLYVSDFKGTHPRFAFYFLQNVLKDYQSDKAAVPGVDRNVLHDLKVKVPNHPSQECIASTLSAYDDLIVNNRRRIHLLEEAANQVHLEWFVRLRFPGYEHTPIINGVPEGWISLPLKDLCKIGRGASPRPIINYMGGEIPWFKIGDATSSESPFVFDTKECVIESGAKKSVMVEQGTLILSNSATCGIPYLAGVRGCVHDGWLHFCDYSRINERFLYFFLRSKREELLNSVSDGSTQKNLNTFAVGRLNVLIPTNDLILQQFDDVCKPTMDQINNLARQNIALRNARDLLLPKLMNGEIAV